MHFEVQLVDNDVEEVVGADSYQQEGPMTTFFARGSRREGIDSWSCKIASFRTERIARIVAKGPRTLPDIPALVVRGMVTDRSEPAPAPAPAHRERPARVLGGAPVAVNGYA
ncbi:MAG: hypothetical protein H6512_04270 [Acidimicrobiia bacterium]|nr:hypothetical protein [Acidimicrobiia bacterium]